MKPVSAKLYLIYRCPTCSCEWESSAKEVKRLEGFFCQNCETFCKFDPIDSIDVVPHYRNKKNKEKPNEVTPPEKPDWKIEQEEAFNKMKLDAVDALYSLGFKRKEAKSIVDNNDCNSIEAYLILATRKK